ncbi:hypothetical protein [Bradyrhizobium liaoningense]|uniref:hypothetical protein n=1 Tax=Bradyrhizobium liaoningense TaxID=43992 RepID=UPI001BAB3C42|nr:hypothetical protein [Bradyrhizobium liaoningense]MBR0859144.1 hypothetical protein [Bradyrhizobium liaoningense]
MASAMELFDDGFENVRFENWLPSSPVTVENARGLEMLVLAGSLSIDDQTLISQSWIRLPAGEKFCPLAGAEGARVWVKDAPLLHPDVGRLP